MGNLIPRLRCLGDFVVINKPIEAILLKKKHKVGSTMCFNNVTYIATSLPVLHILFPMPHVLCFIRLLNFI